MLKAAADAETRGWKLSEEKNGWYLDQLKTKGMAIIKPSEQLTADLRRVGNIMLAEWQRKAGDEGRKVIDAYRNAADSARAAPLLDVLYDAAGVPGGVVLGRHARDGAGRHRAGACSISTCRHRRLRRLLHGAPPASWRSRTR